MGEREHTLSEESSQEIKKSKPCSSIDNHQRQLITITISLLQMILCTDRLVFRLLAGFEASRDALDQLVEKTFIEEGHRVPISIRDGRDHPV